MVTPLCPLCMEVSQINSLIAETLSQNQILHGYVAYTWSYDHFCEIFAYLRQNLVAMATSLRPLQSGMSSLIDWLRKLSVISNRHILVISHRQKGICSKFSSKIGCNGNAPLSLAYGSVIGEYADSWNALSKPNSAVIGLCHIQVKVWPFLWDFRIFRPKFGCHGNVPWTLQSGISRHVDCQGTPAPPGHPAGAAHADSRSLVLNLL